MPRNFVSKFFSNIIFNFQDQFDDGEEMTSEKLIALEMKKKQEKEAQIQSMKDREEAALASVCSFG